MRAHGKIWKTSNTASSLTICVLPWCITVLLCVLLCDFNKSMTISMDMSIPCFSRLPNFSIGPHATECELTCGHYIEKGMIVNIAGILLNNRVAKRFDCPSLCYFIVKTE